MIWPKRSITCVASGPSRTGLLLTAERALNGTLAVHERDAEVGLRGEDVTGPAVREGGRHVVGVVHALLEGLAADGL